MMLTPRLLLTHRPPRVTFWFLENLGIWISFSLTPYPAMVLSVPPSVASQFLELFSSYYHLLSQDHSVELVWL